MTTKNKKLFKPPYSYKEGFIFSFLLTLIGFVLEYISPGQGLTIPGAPYNIYILAFFALYIIATKLMFKNSGIVKWLSSIPASVTAIASLSILVLLMGFIPEYAGENRFIDQIGLSYIKKSWVFVINAVYVLIILGYVIINRLGKLTLKNFAFFLNHFGLWLILAAALIGTGDLARYNMQVEEGSASNIAVNNKQEAFKMPFTIALYDFKIEEYPSQIILFSPITNEEVITENKYYLPKDSSGVLGEWSFVLKEYFEEAETDSTGISKSSKTGAPRMAELEFTNKNTGEKVNAKLSAGSFTEKPRYAMLNNHTAIGLSIPQVKKYVSEVLVSDNSSDTDTIIEVNKPINFAGWDIYQSSYNEKMGKWSTISVFELIYDPWMKVVFAGIYMLLVGSVFLFWLGKYRKV